MVSWYNSCTVDWTLFFVFIKTGFIIFLVLNAYFLLSLKQTLTENKHAVFNARGQVHFPKGDFPSYNFPSGNFPKVSLAVIWGCNGGQTLRIGWFRWPIGAARTGWSRALRLGHTWKITNGKNLLGNYHVHLYNCTVLHLSVGGTKYCKINCLNAYYVHLYNCTVLQLSVEGTRYCTINCNGYYVYLYNCTVLQLSMGDTRCCTINCNGYHANLYICTVLQLSMGGTRCCAVHCNGYCILLHSCCASNVCRR